METKAAFQFIAVGVPAILVLGGILFMVLGLSLESLVATMGALFWWGVAILVAGIFLYVLTLILSSR